MKFDHVIHFIEETPEQAVEFWKSRGHHAVIGGRHEKWGTHNALMYGKDSYIEWLSLEQREVAESADHPLTKLLLDNRTGFGTICLRVKSIDGLNKRLADLGYQTSGILDGSRRNTEGKLIEWKMLFISEEPSSRLPNPFFIQWSDSDEVRFEALRGAGAMTADSERLVVERCIFGVEDVEETTSRWKEIFGGSLQLPNCQIEFRKSSGAKERLEEVRFLNGIKKMFYENGNYLIQ